MCVCVCRREKLEKQNITEQKQLDKARYLTSYLTAIIHYMISNHTLDPIKLTMVFKAGRQPEVTKGEMAVSVHARFTKEGVILYQQI